MIKVFKTMKPVTHAISLCICLITIVIGAYIAVTYYSDTARMVLGKYEDKFYRATVVQLDEYGFVLQINDSASKIDIQYDDVFAYWDGESVETVKRYIPSKIGDKVVWGVRYRSNGTIMYAETLFRKETDSNAEKS